MWHYDYGKMPAILVNALTSKQGNPSCENSEANAVLMLSDSLPHALNIHTHTIMIEEMFYKMADW